MKFIVTLMLAGFALSGCGIADHFTAQSRMDDAEKSYRTCLNANVSNPQTCAPLKQVWDTDKANYEAGRD